MSLSHRNHYRHGADRVFDGKSIDAVIWYERKGTPVWFDDITKATNEFDMTDLTFEHQPA